MKAHVSAAVADVKVTSKKHARIVRVTLETTLAGANIQALSNFVGRDVEVDLDDLGLSMDDDATEEQQPLPTGA